jgi:Tfp pilus assembly protein PilZ
MSEDLANRRRHRRVAARLPVRISTIEPERDRWTGRPFFRAAREECANLSRGGLFVRTSEPLAPGRRILIEVSLPNGRGLEAIGRVAWSRRVLAPGNTDDGSGVGIEFLGGSPDHFADLERYLGDSDAPSASKT